MHYLKNIFFIIICYLLSVSNAFSQQQHDHNHDLGSFNSYIPDVTYTIRAEIIPESLLVRGMIEVEFKNHYKDSLVDILFHLDRPGFIDKQNYSDEESYMHFDSILYYGAPVSKDAIEFDGTNMLVTLPHTLSPNQKGFFLMSFSTKISEKDAVIDSDYFFKLSGWYPRVAYRKFNSSWFGQTGPLIQPRGEEYARHYIGLKIDSSYSLNYSGKLNNEKEHYGLIPKQEIGEVWTDLEENYSKDIYGGKYSPVYEDGSKKYFINQPIAETFTAVVRKNSIHDRASTKNVTIDVFYTEDNRDQWEGTIANLTMEIITKYEIKLGKFKYPYITISSTPFDDKRFLNEPFILIPESIDNQVVLYSCLAARIFRLWFTTPIEHGFVPQDAPEARALNIVQEILYNDFDDKDYKYFLKLLNWLDIIDEDKNIINTSIRDKLAWMQISKYWHNKSSFIDRHKLNAEENMYLHSFFEGGFNHTVFDFHNLDTEQLLIDPYGIPHFISMNDQGIDSVALNKIDSGYKLICVISGGYYGFPIDIGIVTIDKDTLIERFEYNGFNTRAPKDNKPGVFNKIMYQEPISIILDPNYHLPDIDRSNNVAHFKLTKFRPHSGKPIFPGYYK